jgi:hypothetical protein
VKSNRQPEVPQDARQDIWPCLEAPGLAAYCEKALADARGWLAEFISQPNPAIGRKGAVCPFVEPALQAGTLHLEARRGFADADLQLVLSLITEMTMTFATIRWPHPNRTMHALVFVLPDLPESRCQLLDDSQASIKPALAERGLMLGQFHPRCPEPAARNPGFLVARSPVPMLALRNMALHDILFLDSEARCFRAYQARFGDAYLAHASISPLFRRLYLQAEDRFSASTGVSREVR